MKITDNQFFNELQTAGIELNAAQKKAVMHVEGPLVVFAGPGSGKTTVLTCRASYLLQVAGIRPQELLIVTFTKSAAEQMQKRLSSLPGIDWIKARSCEMGTFHSVFLRILLRTYGRVPKLLEESEQRRLLRTLLRDYGKDGNEEEVSDILTKIGLCKNNLIFPKQIRAKKKENLEFKKLYQSYETAKMQSDRWDYDDILIECYRLLQTRPDVRNEYAQRYAYILVDEFQDTNFVQYEVIKMLAVSGNLCIVGDDDQSIYRFRGSKVEFLLEFEQEFPAAKKVLLETNYRSTDQIIETAVAIIKQNQKRETKQLKGTGKRGNQIQLMRPLDERDEAIQVIGKINLALGTGIDPEEIAVLYRSNTQIHALIDELVRQSLPFSVRDTEGEFYSRWQIRDLLSYFRLSEDPNDLDSLVQIMNRPKRYMYEENWLQSIRQLANQLNSSYLTALLRLPKLEAWKLRKLEQLVWDLKKISGMTAQEAVRFVRTEIGYDQYLGDYAVQTGQSKEQVFEPVETLQQLVAGHSTIHDLMLHVQNTSKAVRKARQSSSGIQLMTLHKAKGLEYDTVFLIGLVNHMLPHWKSIKDKDPMRALEEERRLLYVGVTRTKRNLYLSTPQKYNGDQTEPSSFLQPVKFNN